jgi:hypothetical protein
MAPWVVVLLASGAAIAADRALRPPFQKRMYMGVPYTVGETEDGFYWRILSGLGQPIYLGQPGSGRGLPTGLAADEAARWYIYHQRQRQQQPQRPQAPRP